MRGRGWVVAVLAGVVLVVPACGTTSEDGGAGAVPTPEELAAVLVTEDDLAGEWAVTPGPGGEPASGVVTEEQQEMLPRVQLCPEASAESVDAADGLAWQAFTMLDMTPQDPLDMVAGDRAGRMMLVQEYLLADDPAQVAETYGLVAAGMAACLGEVGEDDDGHTGTSEAVSVPEVGDERFAELDTIREPGDVEAVWYVEQVLVRDGPVLMYLAVTEVTVGEGVARQLSTQDVDAVVSAAAAGIA